MACQGEPELRAEIEELLVHDASIRNPLDEPLGQTILQQSSLLQSGAVIGPYKIREQIGEGGFGQVYVAEQTKPLRRKVALKLIKPGMDSKEIVARFQAEREVLAIMDHPHVAKVLDAGTTSEDRPFFVMELIKGIMITEFCDQQKLNTTERLKLFIDTCRAVQHAHQKGIIHRDLKPSNILVTMRDDKPIVKVIDFGIAKALTPSLTENSVYTAFGQMIGTPMYMSPEQAQLNEIDVDTRSDVYSLGVLLYEILTGVPPFDPETLKKAKFDEMRRIIREDAPLKPSARLSTLGIDDRSTVAVKRSVDSRKLSQSLKGELDWVVMKALEKDRDRRYESPNALVADIERYLEHQPVSAGPPTVGYRVQKFIRRNKATVTSVIAVTIALVVGTSAAAWQTVKAIEERNRAVRAEGLANERLDLVERQKETITQERDRATAAELLAAKEEAIAKAVNNFLLEDLLEQVDPEIEPDRNIMLRTILDRAAERISGQFEEQPLIESTLSRTIGLSYQSLGLYDVAEPHLRHAFDLNIEHRGEEDSETINSSHELGVIYRHLIRYEESERLLVKTLEMRQRVLGDEDPQTLNSMNSLAVLYSAQGQQDKAEQLYSTALTLMQKVSGEEDPSTLSCMTNLGAIYVKRGKLEEAEPLLVKALEIRRRVSGEEHPKTLHAMSFMGSLHQKRGQDHDAELLMVKSLEVRRRVLGVEHSDTRSSMSSLGLFYRLQGRYEEAESLLTEAVEIARREFGEEDYRTGNSLFQLGVLYIDLSRLDAAEPLLLKALEIRKKYVGEKSDQTLYVMHFLGKLYVKQHRYDEAETLLLKTIEGRQKTLGAGHKLTQDSVNSLTKLYKDSSQPEKAEVLLIDQLSTLQRELGSDHSGTLSSMTELGLIYRLQGRLAEAESLLTEAVEIARRELGEDDFFTVQSMFQLGVLYIDQSRHDEAEPLLTKALEVRQREFGGEHARVLYVMHFLGKIYAEQRRHDEAEALLMKTIEGRQKKLGAGHHLTRDSVNLLKDLYTESNQFDKAKSLLVDQLSTLQRVLGDEHRFTLEVMVSLGNLYQEQGEFSAAQDLFDEYLEIQQNQLENESPQWADVLALVAKNQIHAGQFTKAERLLQECMAIREEILPDHWVLCDTKALLGATLAGQQKFPEAERFLVEGYAGLDQKQEEIPVQDRVSRLAFALEQLVSFYESRNAAGDSEQLQKYQDLLETIQTPSNPATSTSLKKE